MTPSLTACTSRSARPLHVGRVLFALLLGACASAAWADTRASLDRSRVTLGESVMLTIETDAGVPDVAPLAWDFDVTARGQGSRMGIAGGTVQMRDTYAYELRPRRAGVLPLPAMRVGVERTAALQVAVVTQVAATAGGGPRGDLHIESVADDLTPYPQQAVGWTVRLYSADPIMSGRLDQPVPQGASLTRVGNDAQSVREYNGRRFSVIERRYLLIADRSGALQVPAPTFEGRAVANFFEDLLGQRGDMLQARGAVRTVRVQPVPATAALPWLPLQSLRIDYKATPQTLAAGTAGTLTVQLVADGANASQLPELQLPAVEGLQVFPEPAAMTESVAAGRPRTTVTRSFSLVPARSGVIDLPGMRIGWWDVARDRAASAELRPLRWTVAPSASLPVAPVAPVEALSADAATAASGSDPARKAASRGWIVATVLFALAWLATLMIALQRRVDVAGVAGSRGIDGSDAARMTLAMPPAPSMQALRQALQTGDFGDVFDVLMAMARPPAAGIDGLLDRLDDERQQQAVRMAQRARYGGGDGPAAREALRRAFADGPRWRMSTQVPTPLLPPLYPD